MIKNEYFTIYKGSRSLAPIESEDNDLQDGVFSDEEDMEKIIETKVVGRLTERKRSFSSSELDPLIHLHLNHDIDIDTQCRVRRNSTGTIYTVSDITYSKLSGKNIIASLRE